MNMHKYEKLKEMLDEELEMIVDQGELSPASIKMLNELLDDIKDINEICDHESGGGYSERYSRAGDWHAHGTYGRDGYDDDDSYARGSRHWVRGHYSRDHADSMRGRRYSRDEGKDYMMEQLNGMMSNADERSREILQRAMQQLAE